MKGKWNKPLIILIVLLLFHCLTNDHFQGDFLNKLYMLFNISLPFYEVHLIEDQPWTTLLKHEQLFHVDQNLLAKALKNTFSPSSVFFFSLHPTTTINEFLIFIKSKCTCLFYFYHVLYSALICWLLFKGEKSWLIPLNFT